MNRILQALLLFSIAYLSLPAQDPAPVRDILPHTDTTVLEPSAISDTIPARSEAALEPSPFDTLPPMREPDLERWANFDTIPPELSTSEQRGRRGRRGADTLQVRELDPDHSPATAIMYALVLPGLGQAYNNKYFKIPIVFGALGGVVYAINFNTRNYQEASRVYAEEQNDINERYLRYWRRNMELSYISLIAVYALQVVDAYVDAQLYYWDVNENLSMRVAPSIQQMMAPSGTLRPGYGLTCSFSIKGRK